MKKLVSFIRSKGYLYFGVFSLFVYEFLFSSLINIVPFNYFANSILVLFFLSSLLMCFLSKQWKKNDNRLFFAICLILAFLFVLSDICNNTISIQPLVLIMVLFSSFCLFKINNVSLSFILFVFLAANCLGLSLIVALNLRAILNTKSIYSYPYLNLDTFASIARNGFCIGLLLIFNFRKSKQNVLINVLIIVLTVLCFIYLLLSFRIGSLFLTALLLFAFLTYYLIKKKKLLLIIPLYGSLFIGFLIILFVPTNIDLINRIKYVFYQLFDLDYIYEGSTRERVMMILRDLSLSLRYPIFGAGTDYSLTINYTYGHNAFGCIAFSYGWFSFFTYIFMCMTPAIFLLKRKQIEQSNLFALYFITIQLFDLFYGMGTLSRQNYLIIGLMFALFVKEKQRAERNNIAWLEVCI